VDLLYGEVDDSMSAQHDFLTSPASFAQFLVAWEASTLPKAQWTHAAHVAVGACYVVRFGASALERTRDGIRRYNEAVGTVNGPSSGYHETLTRFWSLVLAKAVAGMDDPFDAARQAVQLFGDERGLHTRYYSFDVVASAHARREWVAPDLRQL
jgi:hypothetical protein